MTEYTFDMKLWAVARVTAKSENEAREKLRCQLQTIDLDYRSDDVRISYRGCQQEY